MDTRNVTVRLSPREDQIVDAIAAREERTRSDVIRRAIRLLDRDGCVLQRKTAKRNRAHSATGELQPA